MMGGQESSMVQRHGDGCVGGGRAPETETETDLDTG